MAAQTMDGERFRSFSEFYPFYVTEHQNRTSRRLHVIGTGLVIATWVWAISTRNPFLLLVTPLIGYSFAWVGHFFFEKNKPATFKYPLWSLMGDFRLFFETVTFQRRF